MKLLVYRAEHTLDAVLIFVDGADSLKEADKLVHSDWGDRFNRVVELDVIGDDDGELYKMMPYEG